MHTDLVAKLEAYRATRGFDVEKWTNDKCKMFNEYMASCGLKAAVVSISGGIDSAVTLAMVKHASKMEGSPIVKVLGVCQPIHSSAWAANRGAETAVALGCEHITIDQTELHNQLSGIVDTAVGIEGAPFSKGQLRSYMRTPSMYYVAQLLSQAGTPCVVMGTGNMDEDGYLAYFCKAGDGVVDVQLIADLHKSEVFKVGAFLNVPEATLVAAPSADLWEGQTDEDELGFTYDFVELYTGGYLPLDKAAQEEFLASVSTEAKEQFEMWGTTCSTVHRRNAHKFDSPKNLNIIPIPAMRG
jgi:NAD+ synthase (glutamine-hydrolysing)